MADGGAQVRFGAFVPQGWRMDLVEIPDPQEKYEAMTRVAQEVDGLEGYDSIWVYDHFHTVPTPELETCFECWSITAGLARDTQRVKIGQMVSCNGYRNPALLAKMASTVDVMSHGRLFFGLGAGWYEHEWRAYGYGFPDTRERMGMFREACQIVHSMFTEDYPEFRGKYYQIDRPINEPKGAHKPRPPIWIGGGGEKVTLKLVAQYGDASNLDTDDLDAVRRKFDVLRGHCEDLGRDPDEIIRSTSTNVYLIDEGADPEKATARARGNIPYADYSRYTKIGAPEQVIQQLQPLMDAGVNYLLVYFPRVAYEPEQLHRFAEEVIPHFQ